jgi:hypothetical protein
MATKQTLKSLLGGSDSRKQVSLDLGTPALRPTVQRAGQYNVAVQATPKTNSAMQLAQALRVAPQVLGQANNIAMDMGAKAAATTMDVEGALDDTERKGILGYDKAYQQGLIKRHFVMNEQAITERFMNLSRTDDSLQMTTDQFVERIEGERQEFVDELVGQFGTNSNRVDAIAALTGSFVDNLRDESMGAWVKNKKDQAFIQLSADVSHMLNKSVTDAGVEIPMAVRVAEGLKHAQTEINAWALDLKPSEKATKLRGIITAEAAVLLEQGKLSQAEALLNEASTYNLHSNAKLFGSAMGKKEISKLRSSIKSARNKVEDNLKPLKANAEILNDNVMTLFLSSAPFEIKQKGMMNALLAMKVPEADAQEQIDTLFNDAMSPNDMFQAWTTLTSVSSVNASDISQTLLSSIQDDNLRTAKEGLFAKPILGITTEEQYAEASTKIKEYLLANPTATLRDIPLGANVPKSDTKVIEMFDTHSAAVKWRNDEASQYKFYSDKYTSDITSERDLGIEFAGEFKSILRQEAQGVWDASGRDMNEFNTNIQVKAKEILTDVRKEASIQKALNARVRDFIKSPEVAADAVGEAREINEEGWGDVPYPILQSGKKLEDVKTSDLVDERKRMLDDNDASALTKGSLLIYGFPTLDSYDEKVRARARIGFQDFALGGEVFQALRDAADGWDIDNPSEEQQKAIQFWRGQGYRSSMEINDILDAQISYYSLGY